MAKTRTSSKTAAPPPARRAGEARLHPRPLLSAAPREPLARDRRGAGLRSPVSRLERPHHRRVLRPQRRLPHHRRREQDHPHHEQLLTDELQLRPYAAQLARGLRPPCLSHDPRRRPHSAPSATTATARPSRRSTTTSSCRSRTSETPAPRSAGASPTSSTASAASPKACGSPRPPSAAPSSTLWRRRASSSPSSRRTSAPVSAHRGILPPPQRPATLPRDLDDTPDATVDTTHPYLVRLDEGRSIAVFFYDGPNSRAIAFEGLLNSGVDFGKRLLTGFPADLTGTRTERRASLPRRHRRRELRPSPPARRDGALLRHALARGQRSMPSSPTTPTSSPASPRAGRPRSPKTPHGAAPTASSAGAPTAAATRRPARMEPGVARPPAQSPRLASRRRQLLSPNSFRNPLQRSLGGTRRLHPRHPRSLQHNIDAFFAEHATHELSPY